MGPDAIRGFTAAENLYEYMQTGECRGKTSAFVAAEAFLFGLELPDVLFKQLSKAKQKAYWAAQKIPGNDKTIPS